MVAIFVKFTMSVCCEPRAPPKVVFIVTAMAMAMAMSAMRFSAMNSAME
jgi:hypothetical protein